MSDVELLQALRDCYDPLLRRNIVDLHLVQSARVTPDPDAPGANVPGVPKRFRADVRVSMASSDEEAGEQMIAQIRNRLAGLPEISQVNISLLPPVFPILSNRVD